MSDVVFRLCTIVLSVVVLAECGRGAFTAAGSRNFRNQHTLHLSHPIQGQDHRHILSTKKQDSNSHRPSVNPHTQITEKKRQRKKMRFVITADILKNNY